ncbi:SPOR domain-containing protein [Methylophilaceae bacterium]|nr:SPOR domain-containing protein [Methylophilaceae bacterium]
MVNPSLAKKTVKDILKGKPVDSNIKYFYIQAGAFSNEDNASYLINRISKIKFRNSLNIKKLSKNSLYLVTIGPYDTEKIAEKALKDIAQKIQLNSFIISE